MGVKNKNTFVKLPSKLTAENGAKYLLNGEFYETIELNCPDCDGGNFRNLSSDRCGTCEDTGVINYKVYISWPTIKDIYKMIVNNLTEE